MTSSFPPRRKAQVQASAVRVREAFVRERFGAAGVTRLRGEASPDLLMVLSSGHAPPGGWVPFSHFVEVNQLVDRLFGKTDGALIFETGRFAASHALGVWKSLVMRQLTPGMLVGLASSMWSKHYDGGKLMSREAGPSSLLVSIADFPDPHTAHCLAIAGWMQGSLELGPRRSPQVQEMTCRAKGGTSCEFRLTWG